ncbi:MAG: mechanosensitive ion channel [Pirellulales bacterium]|nr:mechanosensitive ion channel [Pirellulales bacterium]
MFNQETWGKVWQQTAEMVGTYLPNVVAALAILVVGWLGALLVAAMIRVGLKKIGLNKHLNRWSDVDETNAANAPQIEQTVSRVVFWLAMLFVLVGFFQTLGLTLVTEPLNQFLQQVFVYAPRVVLAAGTLLVAWIVARVLRFVVRQMLTATRIDERLSKHAGVEGENAMPLAKTIGETVYWLTFLLFLPGILGALAIDGLLQPVQNMLTAVLTYVPQVFGAVLILAIGWFVARIVQRIVTNLLASVGTDQLSERVGVSAVLGKNSLSSLIGLVTYILILIPVLIGALQVLAIDAVTQPASRMLDTLFGVLPSLFAAFLVVAIAYVVGRIVASLVTNFLHGVGFDRISTHLGVKQQAKPNGKTPSQIIGYLVLVAVILLATMQAMSILQFTAVAELMQNFLVFAGNVVLGVAIFGFGLYIAKIVAETIRATDVSQADILAPVARVSIWVLATTMALLQMGLAKEIVILAFGLAFGAVAVAGAIAFGIGGRDAAKHVLDEFVESRKYQRQF